MGKYITAVQDHLILPARVLQPLGQQDAWRLAGRRVPASVPVRLIIDAGSKRSTLVPGVLAHLKLIPQRSVWVETSLAAVETTLFWVHLEFPGTSLEPIPMLLVARMALPPSLRAFHGLIGRDLLHQWESFLFQGRRGRLTIRDKPGGLFSWLWP